MAVRLSREPDGYSVLLCKTEWLDPALIAPELARVLKLPRSDTVRACRLQRGIVFEGAEQDKAEEAVKVLDGFGVEALAVPDGDVPIMPKPVMVSLSHIEEKGFATPSVSGAGLPKLWEWGNLVQFAAGILIDPQAQSAGLFDKVEEGFSEAADRQSVAARQLERARSRVFPLADEISRGGKEVGAAMEAALTGKAAAIEHEVEGFGRIGTVIDLLFTSPFERLRVTGGGRITGLEHTASRARNLHLAVKAIAAHAPGATQPGATIALAHGADSGDYLFEDLSQFDYYCRWAYFWRLRRASEFAAERRDSANG
jgi:hypothetical protein